MRIKVDQDVMQWEISERVSSRVYALRWRRGNHVELRGMCHDKCARFPRGPPANPIFGNTVCGGTRRLVALRHVAVAFFEVKGTRSGL